MRWRRPNLEQCGRVSRAWFEAVEAAISLDYHAGAATLAGDLAAMILGSIGFLGTIMISQQQGN